MVETNTDQTANMVNGLEEAGKYPQDLATNLLAVLKNGLVSEVVDNADRYITWARAFTDAYRLSSDKAKKGSRQQLEELIDHGGFIWHVHKFCNASENDELVAIAFELAFVRLNEQNFSPKPSVNVPVFGNFHQSSQWFDQLLNGSIEVGADTYSALAKSCASRYLNATVSLAKSDYQHAKVAQRALIAIAASDVKRAPQLVSSILSNESWLRSNNPQLLTSMLDDTKDNINDHDIESINLDKVTVPFLTDALTIGSADWKKYDAAVAKKFRDLNETSWTKLLQNGGNAYELLIAKLDGLGAKPKIISANLRNPLEGHFLAVLSGSTKVATEIGDRAFEIISNAMRKSVVKAAAGKFSQTGFSVDSIVRTDDLFPKMLNEVFAHTAFASTVDVVITSLVATKDERVLAFLNQHAQTLASQISKCNDDGRSALKESFLGWYEDSQSQDKVANAAQSLGLAIEFPNSSTESESDEGSK